MPRPSDQYHRGELGIALDPTHPAHILPPPVAAGKRVLDIGCGAGQTLIARYPDRVSYGIDVDLGALRLGRGLTQTVRFTCASAEALPFADGDFDVVVSRGTLQFSNLPVALREIRRVLGPRGEVWLTLHPLRAAAINLRARNLKGYLFFTYTVVNSLLFHALGQQVAFPGLKRYESFQTATGMHRFLLRLGFTDISIQTQPARLVVAARLRR